MEKAIKTEWVQDETGAEMLRAVLSTGHVVYAYTANFLIQEVDRFCSERDIAFDFDSL